MKRRSFMALLGLGSVAAVTEISANPNVGKFGFVDVDRAQLLGVFVNGVEVERCFAFNVEGWADRFVTTLNGAYLIEDDHVKSARVYGVVTIKKELT